MIPELYYIENITNEIDFHLETKSPFTLDVFDEIGKLKSYIERVFDIWNNKPTKALADDIKLKLANVSPLYLFLFYCKDNTAVNNVSGFLKKRKMLLEDVNKFSNVSEEEMNLPSELDTVEAKELLKKAIEAGLMKCTENGLKWVKTASLYGYFVDKVSDKLNLKSSSGRTQWKYFRFIENHKALLETAKQAVNDYKNTYQNPPEGDDIVNELLK